MVFEKFVLLSAALAWFLAQGIKTIISLCQRTPCNWRQVLFGTGGMPSSHSAFVSALCVSIYASSGLTVSFLLALGFAVITIRDAVGVRQEVGHHARVLNQLITEQGLNIPPLPVKTGHKPIEVFVGIIVGCAAVLCVLEAPYLFSGL